MPAVSGRIRLSAPPFSAGAATPLRGRRHQNLAERRKSIFFRPDSQIGGVFTGRRNGILKLAAQHRGQEIRSMSIAIGGSFWQQNQQSWSPDVNNRAPGSSILAASPAALFKGANNASNSSSSTASRALDALLGPFGATVMNSSTGMAVLAAQQAADRVKAKAAAVTSNVPTTSVANVATQVTFSGSLAIAGDFTAIAPAANGGYHFLSGTALQNAFNLAMLGKRSNGDAVDTVSVSGNTLTGSTSGLNAHTVFTLTLKPNSGLYTFNLANPIDLPTSRLDKFTTMNLSLLVQAVMSDGTTAPLPNRAVVEVHNGLGSADGTAHAGVVHEGGLAYTGPNNTPPPSNAPAARPKYVAPINPLTGRSYSAAGSALTANADSLNVLT
jgi:hypothetical protein